MLPLMILVVGWFLSVVGMFHLWGWILQAAPQVAGGVIAQHPTASSLGSQIGLGGLAVKLIDYLKAKNWFPWLSANTVTANKIVSAFIALASAIAMTFTWDRLNHQLIIGNIPTLAALGIIVWTWAKQYILQEWFYGSTH